MKSVIESILKSVGAGVIVYFINRSLSSDFLSLFLRANLVTILFALMAINGATLGVILTKLRELVDRNPSMCDFSRTRSSMLLSVREQVALIPVSLLLLIAESSPLVTPHQSVIMAIQMLLPACLAYALFVLYDTVSSVFVLLEKR